jgi:hypothetical protein
MNRPRLDSKLCENNKQRAIFAGIRVLFVELPEKSLACA